MGEVAVSTENEIKEKEVKKNSTADGGGAAAETAAGNSTSVVRWERFLPNMAVRVLLVEADDSTRQIVAALLRKCSYKAVAAVSDGLKAWELLKGRPHNIDLILTEVELPSVSGYALLTLIMEHDICKNIPVIMMSWHDSVSTVYKCMLRGAADFLVKPVRKNELRNLWQHVWRRQASSGSGPGPPDESLAQQKIEATAENNASSCTKPELEAEGADIEHVRSLSQPDAAKCPSDDLYIYTHEEFHQESRKTRAHDNETEGNFLSLRLLCHSFMLSAFMLIMSSVILKSEFQDKKSDDELEQVNNVICQNYENNNDNNNVAENSSREAIDLIGAFDNYLKGTFESPVSNASANKFDVSPPLDLSLRRSHPSCSVNQVNDLNARLNHSDASAFSRYINKPFQARNSVSSSTCNQHKDRETNPEKQLSNHTPDYNFDTPKLISVATFPYPQQREISQPIPVKGVRFENTINGFVSITPQMYSPCNVNPSQSCPQSHPFYHPLDGQHSISHQTLDRRISNTNTIDQTDDRQGQKMENFEDRDYFSPTNDQSGNSSFYNGNSNVKINNDEEGFVVQEGACNRSLLREAALNKFRQKRKDRCFEKKVRYESRKKLAEQRPRVKGQFVRQLPNDPNQLGSSSAS
ncbi:hypothetical protein DH2020_047775 [Rehmannia glutinosa]|uniref:Two-component response regulator-like protein n=1 Tax=Rehmannia glutinosa TaxID=99300 RepID=A0ABR0U7K9_REHGL